MSNKLDSGATQQSEEIATVMPEKPISRKPFWRKTVLLGVFCLAIICIVVAAITVVKNGEKINQPKVQALLKATNCSSKAQQSVSKEKVTPKQLDASITLLDYRASCLAEAGQYKQANVEFEELLNYYAMKNDNTDTSNITEQIAIDNYSLTHPISKTSSVKPEISPAEAKEIDTNSP